VNVAQLKRYCRGLPDAVEVDSGEPYNWLVYSVAGRKFAYFKTSEPERWRFSVRVTPDRFVELTENGPHARFARCPPRGRNSRSGAALRANGVPNVKPARYRGRHGWITIVDVAAFPADYLRVLVDASYDRAIAPRRRTIA